MNAKTPAVAAVIVKEKPSARRNGRELKTLTIHIQFETDGADIDDEASRVGGVELAPQIADLDVNDIGLRHEFEVPHILEQHGSRHDLTGAAQEIFEQGELPRQQIDQLAVAPHGPLDEIHL